MAWLRPTLIFARWSISLSIAATAVLTSEPVGAEPTQAELNRARAQFQQGLALETAGDWAGALRIFQAVAAVRMTPQVRFNIALCEEHLGRLAVALGDYKLALAEAEAAKIGVILEQAPAKIEALNLRVPKVVVRRGAGAEYATIVLDGVALGVAGIGTEMPVDPGPHTVEARAPGFSSFANSFHLRERERKTVEVALAKIAATSKDAVEPQAENRPPPESHGEAATSSGGRSIWPYVAWGVGAAGLAASAGFYFGMRTSAVDELDRMCGSSDRSQCLPGFRDTQEWQDANGRANAATAWAAAFLGIGAVSAITGVVLYVVETPSPTAPTVEAWVRGGESVSAGVRGRF